MATYSIQLKNSRGDVVHSVSNYNPSDHVLQGTNPQRYLWDVESANLPANDTYSISVTPSGLRKVAQQTIGSHLSRVDMEEGAGGGGRR
jgi:hypothetical protein